MNKKEMILKIEELRDQFEVYKNLNVPLSEFHFKKYPYGTYTYLLAGTGWFYIGMRIAKNKNHLEDLKKYCSSSDEKDKMLKDPELDFIILEEFETSFEASLHESFLHEYFDVKNNPLFLNKANQTPYFISGTGIPAVKIDRNGNVLEEYPSIAAAVAVNGCDSVKSPYKRIIDVGFRLMPAHLWEEIKDSYNYDDWIYNPSRDCPKNRVVIGVHKDSLEIETYCSISEASKIYGGSVGAALNKDDVSFVGDRVWFEEEEYYSVENIREFISDLEFKKGFRAGTYTDIIQETESGEFIGRYKTIKEAAKKTGATQICSVLAGKQELSGGFKWRGTRVTEPLARELHDKWEMDCEIRKAYRHHFGSLDGFWISLRRYDATPKFKANENIFDKGHYWDDRMHFIMRWKAGLYIKKAFQAMLIDVETDLNVAQDLRSGNIGSFQRLAKCWTGANTDDDSEFGSGRFMKRPRIATFPNDKNSKIPITKRISIVSSCSHHTAPFSTLFGEDSYAIVSYVPGEFVLGISKLQRLADYVCRRFWLQEDLTKALYDEISDAAKTKDVYVGLFNLRHTCEWLRGSRNCEGGFSSEYYEGAFMDDALRYQAIQSAK